MPTTKQMRTGNSSSRSRRAIAPVDYKDHSSDEEDILSEHEETVIERSRTFSVRVSDIHIDDEIEDEDEYVPSEEKSKSRSNMKKSQSAKTKYTRTSKKVTFGISSKRLYQELEENLIENPLFQSLQEESISVIELASDWLDDYQDKYSLAMKNLINLILRACGCLSQVEEHDVSNVDTAVNTVNEIQNVFEKQGMHQYPFVSKTKAGGIFRNNFVEFFGQVIILSNERNLLVTTNENENENEEDSELLEIILIWLSSLSTCNIRSLRYISTNILLKIETTLCEILIKCVKHFDKNQNNFNAESLKLEETKKLLKKALTKGETTKHTRDLKKYEEHMKTIKQNMDFYSDVKNSLQEYLADVFDTVFIHRFKDIDPKIRAECIKNLYHWIEIYPQYFLDNSFLRYFGWLLFDENTPVRVEVLKNLNKLYKKNNNNIISGLKQFTERFKSDIIKLLMKDNEYNVKSACLNLLIEINRLGFLEDFEIFQVNSMTFKILKNGTNDIFNEFDKVPEIHKALKDDSKLLNEMMRFMNFIEQEKVDEMEAKFKLNISKSDNSNFHLNVHDLIKFKMLIKIIHMSKTFKQDSKENELEFEINLLENESFSSIAELYSIGEHSSNEYENILGASNLKKLFLSNDNSEKNSFASYFQLNEISMIGFLLYKNFPDYFNSWKFLLNCLTFDMSSVDKSVLDDEDYKKLFEISEIEEFFLLNLLYGVLYGVLTKEPLNYYIDDYFKKKRLSKKELGMKKRAQADNEENIAASANEGILTNLKMNAVDEHNVVVLSDSEEDEGDVTLNIAKSDEKKPESPENVISRLINVLPTLYNKFEHTSYSFKIVFKLFINFVIKESSIFQSANEESLICEKLVKRSLTIFKEITNLTEGIDEISTLKVEFTRFFQLINGSIKLDEISKEIKLLVQNLIIELFLELSETLNMSSETNQSDFQKAKDLLILTSKNIQKILIIGQFFNVSEYTSNSILVSLKEKIFKPLRTDSDSVDIDRRNSEEEQFYQYFDALLQFYLLYISLKISKLYDFARNNNVSLFSFESNLSNQHEKGSLTEEYFKGLSLIIDQFKSFIENDDDTKFSLTLRSKSFKMFANILISFSIFKKRLIHNNKLGSYFVDFDSFLLDEDVIIREMATSSLFKTSIMNIFLHFENNVAILLDSNLDRTDEEDVNYGYVVNNESNKNNNGDMDDTKIKLLVLKEIELVSYTLKILDLRNIGLLEKDDIVRLYLNKEKLGPLYRSILDSKDNIDIAEKAKKASEFIKEPTSEKHTNNPRISVEKNVVDSDDDDDELITDADTQDIVKPSKKAKKISLVIDSDDDEEEDDDDPIVEDTTQQTDDMSQMKNEKRGSKRSGSLLDSEHLVINSLSKKKPRRSNMSMGSKALKSSARKTSSRRSSRKLVKDDMSSSDINEDDSDIEFIG